MPFWKVALNSDGVIDPLASDTPGGGATSRRPVTEIVPLDGSYLKHFLS